MGKTVDRDGASYLQLSKGVLLRPQSAGDSAMVTFEDYTIDLSQFIHAVGAIKRPNERSTAQLMAPDARDRADPALLGHIRSELLDRLASPLYALVAGLIAFAALGEARHPAGARTCDCRRGPRVCCPSNSLNRGDDALRGRSIRRCIRLVAPDRRLLGGSGSDLGACSPGEPRRP